MAEDNQQKVGFEEIKNGNGSTQDQEEPQEEERVPKVALMGHARDGPKKRSSDVMVHGKNENIDFNDMQLSDDILKGLRLCRYDKPTPIQLSAIPLGKLNYDLLLQAKSGTGKTCVFTVCILQEVVVAKKCIQAIIMTPSREIAVQIAYVMKSIGAFKDGLKVKEFIGGTSVAQSIRRITNCHVAIGTPGRLAHMVKDYNMDLSNVRIITLDEADKLMEPSFFQEVQVIFNALPEDKQMITTSATYSETVLDFLEKFMRSPCRVQLDLSNPALCAVDQYLVDVKRIMGGTGSVETEEAFQFKFGCLKEIIKRIQYTQTIIFSNWQLRAEKLYDLLKDLDMDVVLLSAARSQDDRLDAFHQLQQGKCKMMVATDVASRGIDVEGIDLVINFDIPFDCDTYVHRIGRTGRFGTSGKAISICSFESERKLMSEFQLEINFTLWVVENREEFTGINDHSQTVRTYRQLKGITEPTTTQDPHNYNWKERFEALAKITIDKNCLHNYIWSGFNTGLDDTESSLAISEAKVQFEKAREARALLLRKQSATNVATENVIKNYSDSEEENVNDSSTEEESYSDSASEYETDKGRSREEVNNCDSGCNKDVTA